MTADERTKKRKSRMKVIEQLEKKKARLERYKQIRKYEKEILKDLHQWELDTPFREYWENNKDRIMANQEQFHREADAFDRRVKELSK